MHKSYFITLSDLELSSAKLAVQIGHGMDMIWMHKDRDEEFFDAWVREDGGVSRKIILKAKRLGMRVHKVAKPRHERTYST